MTAVLKAIVIMFSTAFVAAVTGGQNQPILDLRALKPQTFSVTGNLMTVAVPRQSAQAMNVTNEMRVTHGADLVGFARIQKTGRGPGDTTVFRLLFKTKEQAAAAEKLLRLDDKKPSPLPPK